MTHGRIDPAISAAPPRPVAAGLPLSQRTALLSAGVDVLECYRVLRKAGLNVVGEVLRAQGEFVELDHYPRDDVFDHETASQYYYHAHRAGEHGHFHTFLRARGMPSGVSPIGHPSSRPAWPRDADALSHLAAISMDAYGYPIGLFATNRWVTDEAWYRAEDVIAMLDRFEIDHAFPSWPVNRWITAMLRLFRPHIESLLMHRDAVIEARRRAAPAEDPFEDRRLEITGDLPISVDDWIAELKQL